MGIAAYNRGSRMLSRQYDLTPIQLDAAVLDRLNSIPRGTGQLFEPTVVRMSISGQWWLMDNQKDGWGAFGYLYCCIDDVIRAWNVAVVGVGQDSCSFFYRVQPL